MPTKRTLSDLRKKPTVVNAATERQKIWNSTQWKRLRKFLVARYPFCMHPKCNGITPMVDLNHIKPLATHPQLAYTISNIVPLCKKCHASVTQIELQGKDTTYLFRDWQQTIINEHSEGM